MHGCRRILYFLFLVPALLFGVSDEQALLRAIAAHPGDDAPRLIYADWLDEHDRAAQAEYIRLSIAAARLEPGTERLDKEKRATDLLKKHAPGWLPAGLYDGLVPDAESAIVWERGLPAKVRLDNASSWDPKTVELLNQMAFVSKVELSHRGTHVEHLQLLSDLAPLLHKARTIRIEGDRTYQQLADILKKLPAVPHLELVLSQSMSAQHIMALRYCPLAPTLESLVVRVGAEGLRELCASGEFAKLRALGLERPVVSTGSLQAIQPLPLSPLIDKKGLPALEELSIEGLPPQAAELTAFGASSTFRALKYLRIPSCPDGSGRRQEYDGAIADWSRRPHGLVELVLGSQPLEVARFSTLGRQIARNRAAHPDPNCLYFVSLLSAR